MKKIIITAFLAINLFGGCKQQSFILLETDVTEGTGSLYGTVKDRETGAIIPFANVAVMSSKKQVITGGQTDFDGKYTIKAITAGAYTLQFSCIGYQTLHIQDIVIGTDKAVEKDVTLQPM